VFEVLTGLSEVMAWTAIKHIQHIQKNESEEYPISLIGPFFLDGSIDDWYSEKSNGRRGNYVNGTPQRDH
jgi:hypothetical protein